MVRAAKGPFTIGSGTSDWTELEAEAQIGDGRCAIFPLGSLGILKLVSLTSTTPYSAPEIGQLDTLVRKFALALEACLSHKRATFDRNDRDRLASILENTADFVGMSDEDGNTTYLNRAGRQMMGFAPGDEPLGMPIGDYHPATAAAVLKRESLPTAIREGIWQGETRLLTKDEIEIAGLQVLMHHSVKGQAYFSTIIRDITERKRLESELRQAHKLEAVGQLAAGVAHDFNNLLTAILGHSELLRRALQTQPRHTHSLDEISSACLRAADLTGQLLALARRQQTPQQQPFSVDDLIGDVIMLLGRTFDPRIEIDAQLDARGWQVRGDRSQMQNVLINLAVNARDAMPEGGRLEFSTSVTQDGARESVTIVVSDCGSGMDAATRSRIFEPFFTTKPVGEGSGLGLAVSYGTILTHNGEIEVQSSVGVGTSFTIHLPAVAGNGQEQASVHGSRPNAIHGTGKILIVDDEEYIRNVTRSMLEGIGYDVETAEGGLAALNQLKERRKSFDAVILDIMMPGLDGAATLRRLRQEAPSLPVLMISGYGDDDLLAQVATMEVDGFLRKPFTLVDLSVEVAKVLS